MSISALSAHIDSYQITERQKNFWTPQQQIVFHLFFYKRKY
jgi:hypothetical protein